MHAPPVMSSVPPRAEPYGAVQRRTGTEPSPSSGSYYAGAGTGYTYMMAAPAAPVPPLATPASAMPYMAASTISPLTVPSTQSSAYQHARITLVWTLLPILLLLWSSHTLLLQVFLFVTLTLYALDLANAKESTWMGLWLGWAVLSGTKAWLLLGSGPTWLLRVIVDTLLFSCLACWCTLQFHWVTRDMPVVAQRTQSGLHFLLPPVAASVVTGFYLATSQQWGRLDRAATGAPHLWAVLLLAGMWFVGSVSKQKEGGEKRRFVLSSQQAWLHSVLLLLVPPLMHLATFRRRIVSSYASFDEWYDVILVWCVPYLLHYGLHLLQQPGGGPYSLSLLFSPASGGMTLRGAFVPMLISLVASLALQQAYLIPACQAISYQFNGHGVSSGSVTSIYLTLATLTSLTAAWVWGRKSSRTGEPLFGEYHEDVVQLSLAATGLFLGKAFGMPWNMTPLPILAFLGLSVWISTRMLRYLAIFLFVAHSTGLVVFSYRFAGINSTVAMAIPRMELGLIRFGMLIVASSCLVGVVAGLAVRSKGGAGAQVLKKFDVPGLLLLAYALLLTALEATLLKCPIPFRDLMGIESHDSDEDVEEMIYDPFVALITSAVLAGITWFMQRYKNISIKSAVAVWSVSLGKTIAVFVEMNELELDPAASVQEENEKMGAVLILSRALAASLMILVMLAPRAFLEPVHVKSGGGARYKRALGPTGKPLSSSLPSADRTIVIYTLLILPVTLVASIPLVLKPLVGVLSGHYSGVYYVSSPALSELVGFAMTLWGVSSLSMINHLLPDGGGELWKRASALAFLMGVGMAMTAPTLSAGGADATIASNPYALISSTGSRLVSSGNTRIGGWGLLSASLGTLLAIVGPLELRERRDVPGQKDTLLLFRLMVFSLMFGCGVAWFITLECMSEEAFLAIFVTATACMAISFFGTVVGVLGHSLELQNFDEVVQVAKVWAGAFPVFGLLAGTTQFVKGAAHPFGMGGWLSTYLTMSSFVGLTISLVTRSRHARNAETRGLGNLSCVLSWVCSVIVCYGRYGVAGLDVSFEMVSVFGISASVLGTFLTSLILLSLEGEKGTSKRGTMQRMAGASNQGRRSTFGINLSNLGPSNKLAPPITAAVAILLLASAYTIFFRGCGWIAAPTSAGDVFAGIRGKDGAAPGDELASIVKRNILHSQAIATSSKLAGSGFWTADNMLGPLLHLGGLVATLPGLHLLTTQLWSDERIASGKILLFLPLNVMPLVICKGIPTLQAASVVGLVGGIVQFVVAQQSDRQSRMRI